MATTSGHQHVGVAMSGGGHRATLFGLGALLYLIDAGKGAELANVSSVSGGSITNGFVGATCDLTTVSSEQFWSDAKTLARTVATGGTVWASPLTIAYLVTLVLPLVAAIVVTLICGAIATTVAWVVALLATGVLAKQRSRIAAMSFDRALFHGRKLADIHNTVDHVMCATDLQTARSAYFSGRFVNSYATGWGTPADLPLSRAVQASACLPGAFNAVSFPTRRHGFAANTLRRFLLVDGGVYDNMGTEWASRLAQRVTEGNPPKAIPHIADELVVVNASAGHGDKPSAQRLVTMPLIGEVMTLVSSNSVLYNQTTAVRRRWMDLRFRCTQAGFAGPDGPLRGATIQIDRSPHALPNAFRGNDDFGVRAKAARELLAADPTDWDAEAAANAGVTTALSKIDHARAASLIRHAYVLTMVNTHVTLAYPLLALPKTERFDALVR